MTASIRSRASIHVDRDIEEVFAYLADAETMDEWMTVVSDATLVAGSGGTLGDRYAFEYTGNGRRAPMELEITVLETPRHLAMVATAGPFPFESDLTLAREGDGTRITYTIEPGADGRFTAVVFTLFRPVVRWLVRRQMDAELETLRGILEAADGSTTTDALAARPGA